MLLFFSQNSHPSLQIASCAKGSQPRKPPTLTLSHSPTMSTEESEVKPGAEAASTEQVTKSEESKESTVSTPAADAPASANDETSSEQPADRTTTAKQPRDIKDKDDEDETDTKEEAAPAPKKAKIAMPPAVDSNLVNVEEYTLDDDGATPSDNSQDDSKIETPNIILFGLHPLVREPPLRKLCEHYGEIQTMSVRSAFASRYGHVEFATVEQAKQAYRALNGAKLLHKAILVQPTKASPAGGGPVSS